MKILYITKFFPPEYGGIETLSKNICDFFHNKKKKIEVISFSKKKTYVSKKNIYKVNFFKPIFSLFSTPISFSIIIFLYKNYRKYDYIHVHTPNPLIELCLILLPIKKLVVSWGSDIINQKTLKFFFNPVQYCLLKKSKKIICLSKNYFNYSKELKPFSYKTVIIPPLIKKRKSKQIHYSKNNKEINLVTVGRLVNYKGHHIGVRAMNFLPKNYQLNIVGDGANKEKLLNQISQLNLKNRIRLFDKANDEAKKKILKKSSIFLMCSTSRAESFGIAILEAISYGLPLIISNVKGSGMNDMIRDNYNGYKFKNLSSIDCSKKILKLSKSLYKLNLFSKNSLRLFNIKFNDKKIESKLKKIYN